LSWLTGGGKGEAGIPPHASAPGTAAVATARDDSFISVVFESLVEEFNVVRYVQEQEEIEKRKSSQTQHRVPADHGQLRKAGLGDECSAAW
jgi:hypothetical protein